MSAGTTAMRARRAGGAGPLRALGLAAGLLAALTLPALLPMLHLAPNRLLVGAPVSAWAALGLHGLAVAGLAAAGAGLLALGRGRCTALAALLLLAAALLLLATGLGAAALDRVAGQPPAFRARLASGAWLALLLLGAAITLAAARTRLPGLGWLTLAGALAAFAALHGAGVFDGLSLAVEYRARGGEVRAALLAHAGLSAAALLLAALACAALAPWRPLRGAVDLLVNGIQVVPAVALLGALVALASGLLAAFPSLRGLGLSALGPGPAVVAIAAYLMLPLWRGLHAALHAADGASLDAATAIGLTPRQILTRVRLPLGAPILVGSLRVASVQGIGLATLAALVGGGGLGSIVFDGMAQFAQDLILLGALPVIALSLAVERGLSLVEAAAHRRWRA